MIDHLDERIQQTGGILLYFYFDYRQQAEHTPINIAMTLLRQLLSTYDTVPSAASDLFRRAKKHQPLPAWMELVTIFRNICSSSTKELYLVFDALDECEEHKHREHILDLIEWLSESNLRILATSRSFPPDIGGAFEDHPQIEIQATDSLV